MDVVRLSTAGAVSAFAVLALVSTARQGRAEPPTPRAPISGSYSSPASDAGASPSPPVRVSPFSLSGPTMPPPAAPVPTIYGASLYPLPRFSGAPRSPWDALIDEAARRFAVPPSWVRGVMQIESGGRTMLNGRPITSTAGAMGLMQVMPATFAAMAERYGLGAIRTIRAPTSSPAPRSCARCTTAMGPRTFWPPTMPGPGASTSTCATAGRFRSRPGATSRRSRRSSLPIEDASATGAAPQVQDLTSAAAMRRVALPAYRPRSAARQSPEGAPLFVAANDRPSTSDRQPDGQLNDALFVRLTHQDQRPREPLDDSAEN